MKKRGMPFESGKGHKFIKSILKTKKKSCIEWPFYKMKNGYGSMGTAEGTVLAHRYVCIQAHGEPTDNSQQARHSCRRRSCVNPNHVSWGTQKDNEDDKRDHGTWYSRISNAALNEDEVRLIRKDYDDGIKPAQLAEKYKTPKSTINKVVRRHTWKHVI